MKNTFRKALVLVISLLLLCAAFSVGFAADSEPNNNRFNVVIVLDSSGSLKNTDPDGLRFEAISQFVNLLAESGNYLGTVVFSTDVKSDTPLTLIESQDDKNSIVESIDVGIGGYTNIGKALSTAVDLIEANGDNGLPSIIMFLSDGNTEMPSDEEYDVSLDEKAMAIQRAREDGISVYSVCLNKNSNADVSEMEQISSATGGEFVEVNNAEDLCDVFNTFYNLIYGTSTITIVDEVFPADGKVEKTFEIPGVGVEEVNIIVYGKTSSISLINPDGNDSGITPIEVGTLSMLKITDAIPGEWKIITTGVPGDQIKINMVYNTNLGVKVSLSPDDTSVTVDDTVVIKAVLDSNGTEASDQSQYTGYSAKLIIMDAYGEDLRSVPMGVTGSCFQISQRFEEGVYKFKVVANGHYITRESEIIGPFTVVPAEAIERLPENTPPHAVVTPLKKTVKVWPFKPAHLTIDMTTLATDAEDDVLRYKIESSAFIEGTDYTVSGDLIDLHNFSLSTGSFDISATDTGGLSCNIEVIVKKVDIGMIAIIAIGAAALIAAAAILIGLYLALTKPFRGTVTAKSYCNGVYRGTSRTKPRGRIKLSAFGMDAVGLNYDKSYFQATGENRVILVTNKAVTYNHRKSKRTEIPSGVDAIITVNDGDSKQLHVKFTSNIPAGHRVARAARPVRRTRNDRNSARRR